MRIDFEAYMEKEQDGNSGSVRLSRDEVYDLTAIAQAMADFLRGCGYDYVTDVAICANDDQMFWGETL